MKRSNVFLMLAIFFVFLSSVWADTPQLINFQGVLRQPNGNPVADGSYSVTFNIYSTANGGSALWTQGPQPVTTSNGLFNVLLGVPDTLFKDSTRFLGITVSPDGEMTPRQRLVSTGYAFSIPGYQVSGDNIILVKGTPTLTQTGDGVMQVMRLGGSVGIGTESPQSKLSVAGSAAIGTYAGTAAAPADGLAVSGNVGVGTATPASATGAFNKTLTVAMDGTGPSLGLNNTHANGRFFEIASTFDPPNSNQRLDIYCAGTQTPIATFAATCRVGIGTKAPDTKLHIADNALDSAANVKISGGNGTAGDDGGAMVSFANNNIEKWRLSMLKSGSAYPLKIATNEGATDVMTFSENGNVGIGTTVPGAQLHVTHASLDPTIRINHPTGPNFDIIARGGTDDKLDIHDGTDVRLALKNGNVGIGTTNPSGKLDVVGTAIVRDNLQIDNSGPSATPILDFGAGSGNKTGVLFRGNGSSSFKSMALRHDQGVNSKLVVAKSDFPPNPDLQTGWKDLITFESGGGRVGIGSMNPLYKLEVVDSSLAAAVRIAQLNTGVLGWQ